MVPLSHTRCPFPSISFRGGTFANIIPQFLLFAVTYVYDFPFTRSPSASGRRSHRDDQLSFAISVTVAAVSGYSLPSPPTLRSASSSTGCFALAVAIGYPLLSPLYPPFIIVGWLSPPLRSSISPSSFVVAFDVGFSPLRYCALLFRRLRLRLPIAPVLLSSLPPPGTCSHRSPSLVDRFVFASVSADEDALSRGLPIVFLQDQLSGSYFGGTRDVASRGLPQRYIQAYLSRSRYKRSRFRWKSHTVFLLPFLPILSPLG